MALKGALEQESVQPPRLPTSFMPNITLSPATALGLVKLRLWRECCPVLTCVALLARTQVWRLLANFMFVGKPSMGYLLNLLWL